MKLRYLDPGQEFCDTYDVPKGRSGKRFSIQRCEYYYRHENGDLFSCVVSGVTEGRAKRDEWLKEYCSPPSDEAGWNTTQDFTYPQSLPQLLP